MIHKIQLELIVMTDRNATVASVIDQDGVILATGSAKRAPGDPYNSGFGVALASARALHNYADIVEDSLPNY